MGINGKKQFLQRAVPYLLKAHRLGHLDAFPLLKITL